MICQSHNQDGGIWGNEGLVFQQNLGRRCPDEGFACPWWTLNERDVVGEDALQRFKLSFIQS